MISIDKKHSCISCEKMSRHSSIYLRRIAITSCASYGFILKFIWSLSGMTKHNGIGTSRESANNMFIIREVFIWHYQPDYQISNNVKTQKRHKSGTYIFSLWEAQKTPEEKIRVFFLSEIKWYQVKKFTYVVTFLGNDNFW